MEPQTVAEIISAIRTKWPVANDLEITLEANPGSVEAGRFAAYREAGVSRISMGLQALNDEDLRRLGRIHTVAEALKAFDIARSHFDRVSFDLIYGRQDQTLDDWRQELKGALSLAIDHLSLYQLTIEQGTAFGDRYNLGKLRGLPNDDLAADMYEITQELTDAAGMPRYEVSNHAHVGAESRHNLIYWRYGDYLGIGPGAHGRLSLSGRKLATRAFSNPNRWLEGVAGLGAEHPAEELDRQSQASEFLMMGLRLSEGIDPGRYKALAGRPIRQDAIDELVEMGMVSATDERIIVLNQGFMILNALIFKLLED